MRTDLTNRLESQSQLYNKKIDLLTEENGKYIRVLALLYKRKTAV